MSIKLYVGGLPYSVTDQELNDFFKEQGEVTSAVVIMDKFSGRSKGFGFVEMADNEAGQNAIKNLDGKDFGGRSITVNEARPQEDRRPSNGGGRRNFGGNNDNNNRRRY